MSDTYNPPAFPSERAGLMYQGMTMRDYFAAAALQGMAAGAYWAENFNGSPSHMAPVAQMAYAAADAMLAERAK